MKATLRRLLAAVALVIPMACNAGELDADALARAIDGLKSNAAEVRFFIGAMKDGQLFERYASVHREELADQARKAAKPLEQSAPPALAAKAARAKAIAARLSAALETLDAAEADSAARQLDKLAKGA